LPVLKILTNRLTLRYLPIEPAATAGRYSAHVTANTRGKADIPRFRPDTGTVAGQYLATGLYPVGV